MSAHDELVTLAPAYVLGALEPDERQSFEHHLATCDLCEAEVRSLARVTSGLAQAVPLVTPRPELRSQVLRAIGAKDAGSSQRNALGRWTTVDWLAYAALVALATGIGLYAMNLRARVSSLEARLDQASTRLAIADREIIDARRDKFETQSAMAILAATDLMRVDLQGAPAAPQAAGRALWSRQSGMVFAATNLPPLPADKTYQVWLVAPAGPVSAGLVAPDETGRSVGIFRTPVDITGPVSVAVTIEPQGGVPAPTGAFYLVARKT